ncbi:MAG TPA: hypothetical protein VGQ83_00025 [Polyangia bacterium]
MKAIHVTIDEALLARIDREPAARRHGRSAFVRMVMEDYLRRREATRVRAAYARGYGQAPPPEDELGPWTELQAWPDE